MAPSRARASGLTRQMLPPDAQTYIPEELQDRDLPLWFAAFECGRRAAAPPLSPTLSPSPQTTTCQCGGQKVISEPEQVREVVKWANPPEQANYGDPITPVPVSVPVSPPAEEADEDSTLTALIAHAGIYRPHIDPAILAQVAPAHDEIGNWIKTCQLPSARLIDMVLDGLIESRGKTMLRSN